MNLCWRCLSAGESEVCEAVTIYQGSAVCAGCLRSLVTMSGEAHERAFCDKYCIHPPHQE